MKRLFFTTALALTRAFVVLSQQTETAFQVSSSCNGPCQVSSACEEHARQAGLPMDGWEIVYGDDGQPKCRRTVVQELCYGTQYRDADSKEMKCCQDMSGLTWIDKPAQLAKCCAKDHAWTYDGGSPGRGGCCPVGFQMRNGACVLLILDPPPCPIGTRSIDGLCIPLIPDPPCPCPVGTRSIDGLCVPLIPDPLPCPVGTRSIDGLCIPLIPDPPLPCPVGTRSIDGLCIPLIPDPPLPCPVGTRSIDGLCIPLIPDPPCPCPVGTRLIDGQCIPLIPDPPLPCPVGTRSIDGLCIPLIPDPCPIGTRLIDGQCIPLIPDPLPCPVGTRLIDGQCISLIPDPCPIGTRLIDGQCIPLIPDPPLPCPVGTRMIDGQCIPLIPEPCPVGTRWIDGQCIPIHGPPQTCGNGHGGVESPCTCTNYPVCGHGKYLGIKYGHCYILSFADGEQLGLDQDHTDYKKNGFFVDIPFKVCHSTTECSRGQEVEIGQSFSLQDQHGLYKDIHSTKGWIDDAFGGTHMKFTLDANRAGKFTGIPTCAGSECALQLYGGPTGGALAFARPMPNPGLTFYGNPKVGQKLRFSEVTCDEYEVPLTSGINLH